MERICKNCDQLLYAHKTYCSSCGAKWIEKRITMRNVAGDFADLYLGFDTRFMRTFLDLIKKPEAVINGYITGRRMAYIDAVRYLLIAVFISGIYMLVIKQVNVDMSGFAMGMESVAPPNETPEKAAERAAIQSSIMEFVTNYQGLILFATIPFLALMGRITFWGKRYYNFTEQCVFYMYTYSHAMIATTPISILLTFSSPEILATYSFISFPLMFLYNAYAYKRCFKLDVQQIVLRTLVSILVILLTAVVIFILAVLIGALAVLVYKKILGN